jgi:phosphatidate cytidylyltransferase
MYLGGIFFTLGIGFLIYLGLIEYHTMLEKSGLKPLKALNYCAAAAVIIAAYLGNLQLLTIIIILFFIILFIFLIFNYTKHDLKDLFYTFSGLVYVAFLFSYLIIIRLHLHKGLMFLILIIACVWVNDSAAYFVGSYLGKNKLCPEISPNKTVEGSVGGIIGALIVAFIGGLILDFNFIHSLVIGLVTGILGQFGDLAESILKRYFKIKDSGNFMPGHGGVLDRFDSILFTVPLLYYYLLLFMN